jgi:predicted lipoprotein with Yx(FWY)xxD motif
MKKSTTIWIIVIIVIVIGLGGWYWWWIMMPKQGSALDDPSQNLGINTSPNQTNNGQPAVPVLTIVRNTTLGDYLVAANGMTLYRFSRDAAGVSNCVGQCATLWPPYIPDKNPPLAGTGVTGEIGTITRSDGTKQVTYNGMPLYFWQGDAKTGDTNGNNYGGVWFLVKP